MSPKVRFSSSVLSVNSILFFYIFFRLKSQSSLKTHIRNIHENAQQQICDICGKTFRTTASFVYHMRMHAGVEDEKIQCDECGMLVFQRNMRFHRLAHRESRMNLKCSECGKAFATKARLRKHFSYHHAYTPCVCKWCGKEFKEQIALTEHETTHTGQILYWCKYCPTGQRGFNFKSNVYKHYRAHHLNEWERDRTRRPRAFPQ